LSPQLRTCVASQPLHIKASISGLEMAGVFDIKSSDVQTFRQLTISSTGGFVNSSFGQLIISPIGQLSFNQVVITSNDHFIKGSFHRMIISSNDHFIE
jgi:hypothetical protein